MDIQAQLNNLSVSQTKASNAVNAERSANSNQTPKTLTKSPSNIIINEEDVMGQITISSFGIEHKFNFASFTTAEHLTNMVCKKFGIKLYKYFGLKRFRVLKADVKKKGAVSASKAKIWLSDEKPIFSQGCDSSTTLFLHHKYWFQDTAELTDPATIEYIYKETRSKIVEGIYPCKEDDLVQLSAIQIHIEEKADQFKESSFDLKAFIPKYALDWHLHSEWIQMISIFVEKMKENSVTDFQSKYLQFAANQVPYLTTQFFPAEYATKEMSKTIPVLIGLSPSGLGIYEMSNFSHPVLQVFHKYSELESCEVKPSATSAPKKKMSSVKPEVSISSSTTKNEYDIRNVAVEEQVTPGHIKFLLIVSSTKKDMKEIRFQVSTFIQNDTSLVNFINTYQESSDNFLYKMKMQESKESVIVVQLFDGTLGKKIRVTSEMTGNNLIDVFCSKIGIKDSSFFQIAALEDGLYRWLSLADPVLIQSVNSTSTLVLKLRFFCKPVAEIIDSMAVHLYFLQISDQIHKGEGIFKMDLAAKLAALELQSVFGDYEEKRKKSILASLSRYLPSRILSQNAKEIGKLIIKEYMLLKSMPKESAEAQYLKIAATLPTYGFTFFPVVIPKVSENAYLAVSLNGASLFNSEMEFIGHYRFGFELRNWINSGQTIKFTVKESRNAEEKIIKFVCLKFDEVFALLNYYSRIRKHLKNDK